MWVLHLHPGLSALQRACSISTSYASFEAELEGSILQHTGAVDYYLETQAPKWTSSIEEHATQQRLHSLFIGDLNTSFWQAFAHSRVSGNGGTGVSSVSWPEARPANLCNFNSVTGSGLHTIDANEQLMLQ
jgi:hypothetical protein